MESQFEEKQKPALRQWTLTCTIYTLKGSFGPEDIGSDFEGRDICNRWQKSIISFIAKYGPYSKVITRSSILAFITRFSLMIMSNKSNPSFSIAYICL